MVKIQHLVPEANTTHDPFSTLPPKSPKGKVVIQSSHSFDQPLSLWNPPPNIFPLQTRAVSAELPIQAWISDVSGPRKMISANVAAACNAVISGQLMAMS